MNYQPNTEQWRKGDVVLHDYDAKEPKMLMVVIGFTRDGLVKTQYASTYHRRTIYKNELKYLHDPKRFNINPELGKHRQHLMEAYQIEWEEVRIWNQHYADGVYVKTTSADGGFSTFTTGPAFFDDTGSAKVHLQRGGNWLLKFVERDMLEGVFP